VSSPHYAGLYSLEIAGTQKDNGGWVYTTFSAQSYVNVTFAFRYGTTVGAYSPEQPFIEIFDSASNQICRLSTIAPSSTRYFEFTYNFPSSVSSDLSSITPAQNNWYLCSIIIDDSTSGYYTLYINGTQYENIQNVNTSGMTSGIAKVSLGLFGYTAQSTQQLYYDNVEALNSAGVFYTVTTSHDSYNAITSTQQVSKYSSLMVNYSSTTTGHQISSVTLDGVSQAITGYIMLSNIQANHTISVSTSPSPASTTNVYCGYTGSTYFRNDGTQTTGSSSSTIINAAISEVNSHSGGIVNIISNITLDASLHIMSNVELISYGVIIKQPLLSSLSSSFTLLSSNGASVSNAEILGGFWQGDKNGLTDHRGSGTWSSYFSDYMGIAFFSGGSSDMAKYVIVENCVDSGIYTYEVSNVLVANCTVLFCGDNPLTFNGNENGEPNGGNWNDSAYGNLVNGGQDVGINTFWCDNCTLEYNTVKNVTQDSSAGASNWGIAAENSVHTIILDNVVSDCLYDIISTSNNTLIEGNTVNGAGVSTVGIQDQVARNDMIIGNNLLNIPTGGPGYSYIIATYTPITQTYNLTLQGNTYQGSYTISDSHETWYPMNVTVTGNGVLSETDSTYDDSLSSISGNNYQFASGDTVTLTSQPNSGNSLQSLTLDGTSESSPLTVTMSANHAAVATFSNNPAPTPTPSPGGGGGGGGGGWNPNKFGTATPTLNPLAVNHLPSASSEDSLYGTLIVVFIILILGVMVATSHDEKRKRKHWHNY
jgi:hypothetical protein